MDYTPKIGEAFNAYLDGNLTNGCPCIATGARDGWVYATDVVGAERVFNVRQWRFEKVEGFYSADVAVLNRAVHAAVVLAKSEKAARKKCGLRSREFAAVSKPKLHALKRALRKVAPRILGAE